MNKIFWFLLCALAGLTQAVALAWPWGDSAEQTGRIVANGGGATLGWLQIAGMALFFGALRWRLAARAMPLDERGAAKFVAASSGVFAAAWLGAALWWLWVSLHVYGGLGALAAALAVGALMAFLALYYAGAAWVWARWFGAAVGAVGSARVALGWAAAWTLAEMARGTWLTGFPWGAVGYAHVDGVLAAWAAWVGVYGVGFLAVAAAALLGDFFAGGLKNNWNGKIGLSLAAIIILTAVVHIWKPNIDHTRDIPVTLLQANIAQDEKFVLQRGIIPALNWYQNQFINADAGMVIAPETAVPLLPQQLPEGFWQKLGDRILNQPNRAAIIGAPLGSLARGYTNSAIGIAPQDKNIKNTAENPQTPRKPRVQKQAEKAEVVSRNRAPVEFRDITPDIFAAAARFEIPSEYYQYHKHHLVPFGEFIPPLFAWFMELINMPLGDFSRGRVDAPSMLWNDVRWAVHICYEDLFGEELVQRFQNPENRPDILVNISNLAWFGDNAVSFQHLNISRMRALELARPVLRATNTGATAAIGANGRVRAMLPPFTRGVLRVDVQVNDEGAALTPYARWLLAAHGLWPLAALAALVLVAGRVHCAAFGFSRVRASQDK